MIRMRLDELRQRSARFGWPPSLDESQDETFMQQR
jgi:hypothetical protein